VIALVDYGAGNLTSVRKAFAALGAEVGTPSNANGLVHARAIVVPGVGHFDATTAIDREWRHVIRQRVDAGVPLLGICLGLQWLFEGSTEAPGVTGLGLFAGQCVRLEAPKVPHVGWNTLALRSGSRLMTNIADQAQVYFTHSYAAPVIPATVAATTYGATFSAAVEHGNVAAVQFHPEKSGDVGLRILRNWLDAL
jgi:imidazole glycerol-phosphate synthase subunit HisH